MVATPDDYPWSSYMQRIGKNQAFAWLDTDPCFESLGFTELERQQRYRDFVLSAIPDGEWELIREAIQRGQLTGQARFIDEVKAIVGRRIEHREQGRPRKRADKPDK
jgi:putative transposase